MIHLSAWMHLRALTLTHNHKPLLSVQSRTKFSLLTVSSDPWTNEKNTLTHTWTSIPVYPLWFSVTGNLVKPCPSLHAEQGITTQLSPQRVRNQPNPAWDYTLLLNFSPSFHAPSLRVWLFLNPLFLQPSSTSLQHFSPRPFCSSFIPYIFDTRPESLCFAAPTTALLSSLEVGRGKTQEEKLWENGSIL